ncbi:MAG TPA: CHASE sensor domain-containing protein, partial [Thermoanaerobaculia bacterium]|nr:CHASE sensor domain-containing protein [Thermoanaerobaculia bacterium]
MRPRLSNVPIRRKLMLIVLLTTGGTLLLAGSALILFNVVQFKKEMVVDLTSLADIVARNSTAVLSFSDAASGAEILRSLSARKPIVAAALDDRNGKLFARYLPGTKLPFPARPGHDGAAQVEGGLVVFRPVELKGERIGTVYL